MQYAKLQHYEKDDIKHASVFALTLLCILFVLMYLSHALPQNAGGVAHATQAPQIHNKTNAHYDEGTGELMDSLKKLGLAPVAVRNVRRDFSTVEGTIVTLGGDNITVFEYPDASTAAAEAASFVKSASTPRGAWKKSMHLYANGQILVFYAGDHQNILSALESMYGSPAKL